MAPKSQVGGLGLQVVEYDWVAGRESVRVLGTFSFVSCSWLVSTASLVNLSDRQVTYHSFKRELWMLRLSSIEAMWGDLVDTVIIQEPVASFL